MQIEITKMSSKGQIVIPKEMRNGIKEGEKLVIIQHGNQLILERVKDMDKNFKEDLEFAKRTEEAWKDIDEGRSKTYTTEEFLKKLRA